MKSFRLQRGSKGELIQFAIGLFIGIGVFWALQYFDHAQSALKVIAIGAAAIFVGCLSRGVLCRKLRKQYPNARWIGLLAVGLSLMTF